MFPEYKPMRSTRKIMDKLINRDYIPDMNRCYQTIRNSSSGFISKPEVRVYIFNRDGNKCVQCHTTNNLQIDHILSVWSAVYGDTPVNILNSEYNLQTLCLSCNASKKL